MVSFTKFIPKFKENSLNKNNQLPYLTVAGMIVSGIWPFKLKWIIFMLVIVSTFVTIVGEFGVVIKYWPDVTKLCIVGSTIITGVRSLSASILLSVRREKFYRMIEKFISRVCVTKLENNDIHRIVQRKIMISNIISISMISSLFLFFLLPLISSHEAKDEMFPFFMYFPFDIYSSYGFIVAYSWSVIAGIGAVGFVVGHDTLMNYMLIHTCMRLKLLSSRIKAITETITLNDGYIMDQIKSVVIRHCEIISFVNDMEELFSPNILIHFLATSILVCILGIQILFVDQNAFEYIKVMLYFITGLGQIFVCCDCGEKLIQSSSRIAEAVYDMKWSDISTKYRADILIIMQRAQRPLKLTAGKFFDLSMETFSSVLKTSFSYFALLKQLIEEH